MEHFNHIFFGTNLVYLKKLKSIKKIILLLLYTPYFYCKFFNKNIVFSVRNLLKKYTP